MIEVQQSYTTKGEIDMSTSGDEAWFSSLLLKENMLTYCIYMLVALPSCDVREKETR
jgi:hypothetical protein